MWNKLTDGNYVSDYYVSTSSNTTYSPPLPRCAYPFQVTAAVTLNKRTGPGSSYAISGTLPSGALGWVTLPTLRVQGRHDRGLGQAGRRYVRL